MDQTKVKTGEFWEEFKRRNDIVAHWINKNLGPSFCGLQRSVEEGWIWLKAETARLWTLAQPYFQKLGEQIINYSRIAWTWLEKNVPVYYDLAYQKIMELYAYAQASYKNLTS